MWLFLILSSYAVVVIDLNIEAMKIPALFTGGEKIQNIIYQVSIGFIVSFMFYYIVVFVAEVRARVSFELFVQHELRNFFLEVSRCTSAVVSLHQRDNIFIMPDDQKLKAFFNATGPNAKGNWIENLTNRQISLWEQIFALLIKYEHLVERISIRSRHPDYKLADYFTQLDKSQLFFLIRQQGIKGISRYDHVADAFVDFIKQVEQLSDHCTKQYGVAAFQHYFNEYKGVRVKPTT
jgi:hypothetical protein